MSLVRRAFCAVGVVVTALWAISAAWVVAPESIRRAVFFEALAQTGCIPNPNATPSLSGPAQFVNGCNIPASGLNFISTSLGANVAWFLPAGQPDGSSDNSSYVQAAVTALCPAASPKGGVIYFPPGRWKFHDIDIRCDGAHVLGAGAGGTAVTSTMTQHLGTTIDCSSMAAYCIRMRPPVFPSPSRIIGNSVEKIEFYNTAGTGNVLQFDQVQAGYARDIEFDGGATPTAIRIYGATGFLVQNVAPRGFTGTGIEVTGDLAGFNASGVACANNASDLATCSTRTDLVNLHDVVGFGASSSVGLYIHEVAATTMADHITFQAGHSGIKVRCAAGFPNASYCPQFITINDFQNETGAVPVDLQDFTWFKCIHCYFVGIDTMGSTVNDITAKMQNYSESGGAGGGFTLIDTTIFNASGSCVLLNVDDTHIEGSQIYDCGTGGSNAGVEYVGGQQHTQIGNKLCQSIGQAGTSMQGWLIDSAASRMTNIGNSYFSCSQSGTNNSSSAASNKDISPNPLPGPPVPSSCTGLGASGTCAVSQGNDYYGYIQLSPLGAGPAATGAVTLTPTLPQYSGVECVVMPVAGTGTWDTGATIVQSSVASSSAATFTWKNGGTNLSASSTYNIAYVCGGQNR